MDAKEVVQLLGKDKELSDKVVALAQREQDPRAILAQLEEWGINVDPQTVDALLAQYQVSQAAAIEDEELDLESLANVAGGGDGLSSDSPCDVTYLTRTDKGWSEVCSSDLGCSYSFTCDESFYDVDYNRTPDGGVAYDTMSEPF